MRVTLSANATQEIRSEGATVVHLALVSGEVNYRIGDDSFSDTTDDKLTEDLRTDSIETPRPTSIYVKAIANSVLQYRRE